MKPRTEAELQKAIIVLAKMMAIDRSLPERRVKLLKIYHIPNGVKPQGKKKAPRGMVQVGEGAYVAKALESRVVVHSRKGKRPHNAAAKLGALEKALGVRRGMPDLHLPVAEWHRPHEPYYNISLYGEVKLPKVKVPEYQKIVHEELRAEGNRVDIWRSVDDAMRSFKEHLAL